MTTDNNVLSSEKQEINTQRLIKLYLDIYDEVNFSDKLDNFFKEHYSKNKTITPTPEYIHKKLSIREEDNLRTVSKQYTLFSIYAWNYNKNEYNFDKDTFNEIIKTKSDVLLPESFAEKLPYFNTLVKLPESMIFTTEEGGDINCDYLMFFNVRFSSDKKAIFVVPIDISTDKFRYKIIRIGNVNGTYGVSNENKPHLLKEKNISLSILSYLISSNCDYSNDTKYKNNNTSFKTIKGKDKLFKSESVIKHNIGFTIGDKIREFNNQLSNDTKKTPHVRRAHFHGYWKGKNKEEFEIKWLEPMFINHKESEV